MLKEKKDARFNITTTKLQKEYVEKQAAKMGIPVSEFIRGLINAYQQKNKNEQLRKAAELLADEYKNSEELTAFTAIDGDAFL